MKKAKLFKKYLGRFSEILAFLFIAAVFIFSLYKIFTIAKIIDPLVYGAFCDTCGCDRCDWDCDPCWPDEPTPTPTPPPSESTPTPTPPPGNGPPPPVGGPPGPPGPPVCGATVPPAPILLSVTPSSSVDLSWTAVGPATHYSISYGPSPGNYLYGVDNTGNVTFYNVGGLDPGTDYCFAVRAVDDCAPSELSNEICTGAVGQVLGATTLADTGSFTDELFQILFIIGSVCVGFGLKLFLPAKELV